MELIPEANELGGNISVITGWRGVGKTALCQRIVAQAQLAQRKIAGLLSPGRFNGESKTGIFAVDLARGERRLLASAVDGEIDGLQFGPWTFDRQVLAWGNQSLTQSADPDLLIIDEIGPLEFEKETGWKSSFEVLRRKRYHQALVVIRPEFLEAFSNLGFVFQTVEVTQTMCPSPMSDGRQALTGTQPAQSPLPYGSGD
jgi:nucleoside-triphosphatase